MLRDLNVVIAVDTQYILHEVCLTLYIHTVWRNSNRENAILLLLDNNIEGCDNTLDSLVGNILTDKHLCTREREVETERLNLYRVEVGNLAADCTTCKLLEEQSSTLEGIYLHIRVYTALEAERRIGIESVTLCALTNRYRVEICALDKDIGSCLANARIKSAIYTCKAHRTLCRADHKVGSREFTLNTIKSNKLCTLLAVAHHNLATLNLRSIKGVQWLTKLKEYEVGNIDKVVLWVDTRSAQVVLHPIR